MAAVPIIREAGGVVSDRFGGPLSATISFGCTAGGALALLAMSVGAGFKPN